MKKSWFRSVLLTLAVTAVLQGQSRESVLKAVQQTSNWSPADQPEQYDEKTIESIEPKRGPAINRYGLRGVTVQGWNGEQGKTRLTLYEMFDSTAAYGLFTLDRNIG